MMENKEEKSRENNLANVEGEKIYEKDENYLYDGTCIR